MPQANRLRRHWNGNHVVALNQMPRNGRSGKSKRAAILEYEPSPRCPGSAIVELGREPKERVPAFRRRASVRGLHSLCLRGQPWRVRIANADRHRSCGDDGCRIGRMARPRGLTAAWVWACRAIRRRPAVTMTRPSQLFEGPGAARRSWLFRRQALCSRETFPWLYSMERVEPCLPSSEQSPK